MVKHMNKFKKGFSLFEACVVMSIVAIFVAVIANVIPHKVKSKVASEAHGRFECYYDNGVLYQQMFTEKSTTGRQKAADNGGTATSCMFIPPSYAKYMIIDAVGGGAGGGTENGGNEGEFKSAFFASVHAKYEATPGAGGAKGENGEATIVKGDGNEIVKAKGGATVSDMDNTTVNDIKNCFITEYATADEYNCQTYPVCAVVDGKIEVSFCRTSSFYRTDRLTYKEFDRDGEVVLNNPRNIINNIFTTKKPGSPNVLIYHDISIFSDYNSETNPVYFTNSNEHWTPDVNDFYNPSLYTMELELDKSANGVNESQSNLGRYIDSMQYNTRIKDVKVGTGGAKNAAGHKGAVLFLW